MHPDFFEDQLAESPFNPHGKEFISGQLVVWSLSDCGPQVGIVAGQQHLQEVVIVEQLITIQVEVLDHLFEVCWLQLTVPIFPLELGDRVGVDVARVAAVDALERSVRLEVAHGRQDLPQSLNRDLLLRDVDKDLLDFEFGLVTEHGSLFVFLTRVSNLLTFKL